MGDTLQGIDGAVPSFAREWVVWRPLNGLWIRCRSKVRPTSGVQSAEPSALLLAPLAALQTEQLPGFHVEAPLGTDFPLVKARAAQRFAFRPFLLDLTKADDVGHGLLKSAQELRWDLNLAGRRHKRQDDLTGNSLRRRA